MRSSTAFDIGKDGGKREGEMEVFEDWREREREREKKRRERRKRKSWGSLRSFTLSFFRGSFMSLDFLSFTHFNLFLFQFYSSFLIPITNLKIRSDLI